MQSCYGNGSTNCYIHARNVCTPLPYCCSSLSARLACVVECVVSVWRIQSASVIQCFTMLHQCFTMLHQCFTMLHQCFTMLHQCFTMLHQCFTMLHQCIYGRKPSMNQPIVGELTLVVVLVCSCVHSRSAMKVCRHASMSALHNCDMQTTVTCTQL